MKLGIRKKIRYGFFTIGGLLFLSGLISSLELVRFKSATRQMVLGSQENIEISKSMLDAVQEQNSALLLYITSDSIDAPVYESMILAASGDFQRAYAQADLATRGGEELKPVFTAWQYYTSIIGQVTPDTGIEWFTQVYKTSYHNLTHAIKEFMVRGQEQTIEHTQRLENSAYRASMVGIIALCAGILLALVFYFMMNTYFVSPVLKMDASLKRYLGARLPYEVHIDTDDEIATLNSNITALAAENRKMKQECRSASDSPKPYTMSRTGIVRKTTLIPGISRTEEPQVPATPQASSEEIIDK